MDLLEVVLRLEQNGGRLELAGDRIRYSVPKGDAQVPVLLAELRRRREEVAELLREREPCCASKLPVTDPYAEQMRAALRQMNAPDYPAGMMPWLDRLRPDLYAELTSRLPDEIHRLWSTRAPLEQFESVLMRLIALHRQCYELYSAGGAATK